MMHYYLQKAIKEYENIGPLQFLNVLRICQGQSPIRSGVEGENHYASVAVRERNEIDSLLKSAEISDVNTEEEVEIKEITEAFESKVESQAQTKIYSDEAYAKMVSSFVKNDNKVFERLNDEVIDDADDEFGI